MTDVRSEVAPAPVPLPKSPHALTGLEIAAIVAIIVVWGVNNAGAKLATQELSPLLVGAIRFGIATACLIAFVRPPFPDWKSLMLIVIIGGPIQYGLAYTAYWLATDVSPVTVANQLWIPFTALFAFLILGERLNKAALVGMGVAFVGVAWMTLDAHALQDWKAILVAIAAGAAWGVTTVVARRTTSIPPLKMQGLLSLFALPSLAFASALFVGPALLIGVGKVLQQGARNIISFIVMFSVLQNVGGLAGSALTGTLQIIREKYHSNQLAAGISALDPQVALRLRQLSGAYASTITDPALANAEGAVLLGRQVTQQANVLAYNDVFLVIAVIAALGSAWVTVTHLRPRWKARRDAKNNNADAAVQTAAVAAAD